MDGSQPIDARFGRDPAIAGQPQRARRSRPAAERPIRAATPWSGRLWTGGLGFVAGAVCWHFVGFWGFVAQAVFHARPDGPQAAAVRQGVALAKIQNRQPGSVANPVALANANCSMAVMEAAGVDLQPRACEGPPIKFRPSRNIVRADRGDFGPTPVPTLIGGRGGDAPAGGWGARIEAIETGSIPARKSD